MKPEVALVRAVSAIVVALAVSRTALAEGERPAFQSLRYSEDFRFLADPARRTDVWDPAKYVALGRAGFVSARFVGTDLSALATWQATSHVGLSAAYTHFFAGAFIHDNDGADSDYVAVWATYRFQGLPRLPVRRAKGCLLYFGGPTTASARVSSVRKRSAAARTLSAVTALM